MNALVICYSNLSKDPRVLRQIRYLSNHTVVTAGYEATKLGLQFIELRYHQTSLFWKLWKLLMLLTKNDEAVYWNGAKKHDYKILSEVNFDLIVANDLEALPLAIKLARSRSGVRVIFDAHEYYPGTFQETSLIATLLKSYVVRSCKNYLHKADHMTTVAKGIGKLYYQNFGVESSVIRNTNKYWDLEPSGTGDTDIQLVHHGYALPMRKIEIMIKMMDYLDKRFTLNFYLVPAPLFIDYYDSLKELAKGRDDRIVFHEPVPTDQIPGELNKYDIGVFILPPTNENYANALPNKFFEFIQARLMIAIGPSPEMSSVVSEYELGLITQNYEYKEIAEEFNQLTSERIMHFKQNSHKAAKSLSEDTDQKVFLSILQKLEVT